MMPSRAPKYPIRRAFSLLELMVVITIIALLAVATLPSLRGVLDSQNLTGAADAVVAEFSGARQLAMTRNIPVEVRIYKVGDDYRTLAAVIPGSVTGKPDEWVSQPRTLLGNMVIDGATPSGVNFSSIIAEGVGKSQPTGPWGSPWAGRDAASGPSAIRDKDYIAFRFHPDGGTSLRPYRDAPTGTLQNNIPWCVSLRSANAKATSGKPAMNFVALVLDSTTGRLSSYRP